MDYTKILVALGFILVFGVFVFSLHGMYASQDQIKIVNLNKISSNNLPPITDLCGRPLEYPVGTEEEIQQSEEASYLYQRGLC